MSTSIEYRHLEVTIPIALATRTFGDLSETYARFDPRPPYTHLSAIFVEIGSSNTLDSRHQIAREWELVCVGHPGIAVERACHTSPHVLSGNRSIHRRQLSPESYIRHYRNLPSIPLEQARLGGLAMLLIDPADSQNYGGAHPWEGDVQSRTEGLLFRLGESTATLECDFAYLAARHRNQGEGQSWHYSLRPYGWMTALDRAYVMATQKRVAA